MGAAELVVRTELALPEHYRLGHSLSHVGMGRGDPTLVARAHEVCWGLQGPAGPLAVYAVQDGAVLRVQLFGADADWLVPRVPALFGLHDEPWRFMPEQPALALLARRFRGMFLLRQPQLMTRLIQVVLLQLVAWRDATSAWRRLVAHAGDPAPGIAGLRCPPPSARIARLPEARLVSLGLTYSQARALRAVASARSALRRAVELPHEQASALLQRIPGVGPWTANYVLGTAAGYADAVLPGDFGLPHAVAWLLAGEPRADDQRMLELLEPFRPHRFRVVRYLWAAGAHGPRRGARLARSQLGHVQASMAE